MTQQTMNRCSKTASGGQGMIPWTPGGRVARSILVAVVLLIMAATGHADEAAQPPTLPPAPSQQPAVVDAPMTDIHDIAPPIFTGLSSGAKKAMLGGGIALAVAALVLFGLWLWFRRKQGVKKAAAIYQPPELLAQMALDRIEPLMARDGKAFYFELSEVTKHYLKGRFGIDAPEMTAEELLPKLPGLPITPAQKKVVVALFAHAEPVKFAGASPESAAMAGDIAAIRNFVTETTAVEDTGEKKVPPAARG